MKLPTFPFVVLDTETTGFIPKVHRVIEFASVRVRDGKQEDSYEALIGINDEIPPHVQVLTRIRQADIEGKPKFEELREAIEEHIGADTMIIGQNVGYDIGMLKGEGIDLSDRPWIDTSMIASLVFPELESYSLGYMSKVLQLNHEPVHRAMGDVHATLELLEKCWERLNAITPKMYEQLQRTMEKAPAAYQQFFGDLSAPKKAASPKWLTIPSTEAFGAKTDSIQLSTPSIGVIQLIDESLDPGFTESVIEACAGDTKTVQWVGVKNLSAFTRRAKLPKGVSVLRPAYQLLNTEASTALLNQESLSTDEATLSVKLQWYTSETIDDLPIHGDERSVWAGKLACTEQSAAYTDQFRDMGSVVVLDHRQLLSIVADPHHPGYNSLTKETHIILDDASMLEDTATKAYGYYCNTDDLRAASAGDSSFSKFVDVLQLWIEKTRNYQDVRYITVSDLGNPEARGIRAQLDQLLERTDLSEQAVRQLTALQAILEPNTGDHRIEWIELRQDGKQMLQSVPSHVSDQLKDYLYSKFPVTLLAPPGSSTTLTEILPVRQERTLVETPKLTLPIDFLPEKSPQAILDDPPHGKTVLLAASRKLIESIYVRYAEALEEQDVTLICQGLSGGQGRMQAEFLAAEGTAIIVMTPWMFESFELRPESIDHLVIDTLPFDHPSHAVIGKRAEHYQNAFEDYSLPRLEHRMFRLLRTFRRYGTEASDVIVLDDRLQSKSYGKRVLAYLMQFAGEIPVVDKKKSAPKSAPKKKSRKNTDQLELF